jgi:hypothetical protein
MLALGALLLAGLAAAYVLLGRGGGDQDGGDGGPAEQLVGVAPDQVRASSTLRPSEGRRYDAANTLDGDRTTAWNSDGKRVGDGIGVTLTYTFAQPVELRRVVVENGYAKSPDVYTWNERVRELEVDTGSSRDVFLISDKKEPQELDADFGTTSTVVLTIRAVYSGQKYKDLAITEVSFFALP